MNKLIIPNGKFTHYIQHNNELWNGGTTTINELGAICDEIEKCIGDNDTEIMINSKFIDGGINVVVLQDKTPIELYW